MSLVNEYNGVKIFVSPNGDFYCDTISNREQFRSRNLKATTFAEIKKLIDECEAQDVDGNEYYYISPTKAIMQPLKIVKRIGDKLFFDDDTDTTSNARKSLYPKSIEKEREFKELLAVMGYCKEKKKEIGALYKVQKEFIDLAREILEKFKKVDVS